MSRPTETEAIGEMRKLRADCIERIDALLDDMRHVQNVNFARDPLARALRELRKGDQPGLTQG